jgi:hypothetical protein
VHQFQVPGRDEVVDVGDEPLGDRVHQGGRGVLVAAVPDEEASDPAAVREPGHPDVEVHPVDALDFEHHMFGQHIASTAR